MYSMCQSKFEKMAKEANAVYKLDKLVLVNCDIFEAYLETYEDGKPGMPFFMETDGDRVIRIFEKPMA